MSYGMHPANVHPKPIELASLGDEHMAAQHDSANFITQFREFNTIPWIRYATLHLVGYGTYLVSVHTHAKEFARGGNRTCDTPPRDTTARESEIGEIR